MAARAFNWVYLSGARSAVVERDPRGWVVRVYQYAPAVALVMPLTLRPTGLGSGIDKDRQDFTIYSGGWVVGRIYETRGGPDHLRWFWWFTVTWSDDALEPCGDVGEAKAQFPKSPDEWKASAKLEERP